MYSSGLQKFKSFILRFKTLLSGIAAFIIPFSIYVATLEPKLIGGDTSWFAIHVPQMSILVPTGYPSFSIAGKLITFLPVGDLAYRLNLLSAVFGALTVLFVFLAVNLAVKNEIISLASCLTLAFAFSFWTVANRFEMDTINTFFLALIIYSAFLYREKPDRKHLYFAAASLGLFLTDHPIAMFVMPAMLLYVIIINPKIFKSVKAVLLAILFFILPLGLYLWLPVRSWMGYGTVKTAKDFLLYVTGRYSTGEVHGGSFGDKNFEGVLIVIKEFFRIILNNYEVILIVIAVAGLIYCFIKNYKFAICALLAIISNFLIISLYIGWAPENHVLDSIVIVAVFIGYGFALIYDILQRILAGAGKKKILRLILTTVLLLAILASPVMMAFSNYSRADASEIDEIYLFWNRIYEKIETGSSLYVASTAANIGSYISIYEQPEKKIKFIRNNSDDYSVENIKMDLSAGKNVYLVGIEDFLVPYFNIEAIMDYDWPRFEEKIMFYRVTGEKIQLEVTGDTEVSRIKFGDSLNIRYEIKNKNESSVDVSSLELELPKMLKYEGVTKDSQVSVDPALSRGKLMWVKTFTIKPGGVLMLVFSVKAVETGEGQIKFRASSQDFYFEAQPLNITVIE